jgi:photosystem II stability/assembly factor-like uncharacterized protein
MIRILFVFFLLLASCYPSSKKIVFSNVASPTSLPLRVIQLVDDTTMYMVSGVLYYDGELYKSIDQGHHWTLISKDFTGGLFGLFFKNKNQGLVTGWPANIFWTKDGGATFSKYTANEDVILKSPLMHMNKIFVAGGIGFEVGAIWQKETLDSPWSVSRTERSYNKLIFNNANTGYLAGYGLVQRSIDTGKTWNITECKGDLWVDVDFTSSQIGYALGYEGKVMKTTDDGLHWSTMRSVNGLFSGSQFAACDFIDESRGMIVGYDGAMEWTDNGGYTWTKIESNIKTHIRDVLFINRNSGFVIGDDGMINSFVIE